MTICKRGVNKVRLMEKTNATLGCIVYVTQDIILQPNSAPVTPRGTTATHSEHRSSRQTGTAGEKTQQNYHQTRSVLPARKGWENWGHQPYRLEHWGERKSQLSLSTANRTSNSMFELQQVRILRNRKLTAKQLRIKIGCLVRLWSLHQIGNFKSRLNKRWPENRWMR